MAKIKNFEFSDVNISKSELIWYLYTNEFNTFRDLRAFPVFDRIIFNFIHLVQTFLTPLRAL